MKQGYKVFKEYLRDESGATAIEYGLIAALIAMGMMAGLRLLGGGTEGMWTRVQTKVTDA